MFRMPTAKKIEQELRGWVREVWNLTRDGERNIYRSEQKGINLWKDKEHILHQVLVESVDRLEKKFKPEQLTEGVTQLYFNPLNWLVIDKDYRSRSPDQHELAMFYVFETLLLHYPPGDLNVRFKERMNAILQHPYAGGERMVHSLPADNHYPPNIEDLGRLFINLEPNDEVLEYASRFLRGDFDVDVVYSAQTDPPMYKKGYESYGHKTPILRFMEYVHLNSDLTYELYCETFRTNKNHLRWHSSNLNHWRKDRELHPGDPARNYDYADSFFELSEKYMGRFTNELADDINEENYIYLKEIGNLHGSRWLLKGAEVHRDFKIKKLVAAKLFETYPTRREGLDTLVIHLANAKDITPEDLDEYGRLVADLKTYPVKTLKYMLPIAREARDAILEALEWAHAKPFLDYILELCSLTDGEPYVRSRDMPNSPDPASGAVDLIRYRELQEIASEETSTEILKLFYDARIGINNTITLLRAADGIGREKIEKKIKRRDQKAVKAFGILPIEKGAEEVFERYIFLQQYKKESKKFGPERQANEMGAVKTALYHLAQVGGYPDVMRLEWDMESRLATEVVPVGKRWEVGEYQVTLELRGADPDLVIIRNEKRLKSVPKAVRGSDDYAGIRKSIDDIREQSRRFRSFFENMMERSKVITREDLELLNRMPVPSFMMSKLILQTSDGELGMYSPDSLAVETLDGTSRPIQEAAIIAHPYHLYEADQLGDWQRFLVNHRIVQPFKQAFRELYIITPAEIESRLFSNRFAGNVVDGGRAVRLFQSRNWDFEKGDRPIPQKLFSEFGFSARFIFPDVMQYWSSDFSVTSDQIKFRAHPYRASEYRDRQEEALIPLTEIPPTIFSEVMRDADLVVSVAQLGDKEFTSREIVKSRIELIQALIEDLNLEGVSFQEQFAYVQGELAKYRVHMGSAVIRIEPGSYLCVVPDNWGQDHKNLFLPFSDAGDRKTSEVISKIFLLLNDDKIKDQSILRQIKDRP